MKLCKNCKYYEGRWSSMWLRTVTGNWLMPWCSNSKALKEDSVDSVTGKTDPYNKSCWHQREYFHDDGKYCGQGGNWFELKEGLK